MWHMSVCFFFSSRRRHTRWPRDWSSDVCSSDLIRTRGGSGAASVREIYTTGSGNVRTMHGWVLMDGRTFELGKAETADLALVDNDVYNESRMKVLKSPNVFSAGMVFGAETEVVERSVFTQLEWP